MSNLVSTGRMTLENAVRLREAIERDGFVELLRQQAADLEKPPISFDELLARLARVVAG